MGEVTVSNTPEEEQLIIIKEEELSMAKILGETCAETQRKFLAQMFDISENDEWNLIALDFHFYNLHFCKEQQFSCEKSEKFLLIMKQVFEDSFPGKTRDQSFEIFHTLMLKYCVDDPQNNALCIFNNADLRALATFISMTFYRHFQAYVLKQKRYADTALLRQQQLRVSSLTSEQPDSNKEAYYIDKPTSESPPLKFISSSSLLLN